MAVDYYLKLDGIQGESTREGHANEIALQSWSWGASQQSTVSSTGGSGAGKVDLSNLSIMTEFDKSTPKFFKSICAGTHIKTGTLSAIKAGADGKLFLKIDFKELFVTSVQASAGNERPSVSATFSYNEIKIEYSEQKEDGTLTSTGEVSYSTKTAKLA